MDSLEQFSAHFGVQLIRGASYIFVGSPKSGYPNCFPKWSINSGYIVFSDLCTNPMVFDHTAPQFYFDPHYKLGKYIHKVSIGITCALEKWCIWCRCITVKKIWNIILRMSMWFTLGSTGTSWPLIYNIETNYTALVSLYEWNHMFHV